MTAADDARQLKADVEQAGAVYGVIMLSPATVAASPLLACSKQFDHLATRAPAVELLLLSDREGGWVAKPRCADHPAVDDVRLVKKASPLTAAIVLKVLDSGGLRQDLPDDGDIAQASMTCPICEGSNFFLQLGGQHSGAICCAGCGAGIDYAEPLRCPGCQAQLELAPVITHRDGCPVQP